MVTFSSPSSFTLLEREGRNGKGRGKRGGGGGRVDNGDSGNILPSSSVLHDDETQTMAWLASSVDLLHLHELSVAEQPTFFAALLRQGTAH